MEHRLYSSPSALRSPIALPQHAADTLRQKKSRWSTPVSMQALVERLSLMEQLELPCAICMGNGKEEDRCYGVISRCSWKDGCLNLCADGRSLHLIVDDIGAVHLVNCQSAAGTESALEIFGTSGALVARIVGTPDPQRAAVWQDIMDSLTVAGA